METIREEKDMRKYIIAGVAGLVLAAYVCVLAWVQGALVAAVGPQLISPYTEPQHWLKANLHTHSTRSDDGTLEPEVVFALYAAAGYDALALTDHDGYWPGGSYGDMVILPGQECHVVGGRMVKAHHVLALGARCRIQWQPTPADVVPAIRAEGGLPIVAHPGWDECQLRDAPECEHFEIWNGVAERFMSEAAADWEASLAAGGTGRWALAADDLHVPEHFARGWVMVNAPKTASGILSALQRGDFYASTGAVVWAVSVRGGRIAVTLERPGTVWFLTAQGRHFRILRGPGETAAYEAQAGDRYVRAEVVDGDGHRAWLNPMLVPAPSEE